MSDRMLFYTALFFGLVAAGYAAVFYALSQLL